MSISALHITSISLLDRKPSPSVSNTLKQTEETNAVMFSTEIYNNNNKGYLYRAISICSIALYRIHNKKKLNNNNNNNNNKLKTYIEWW